MATTNHFPPPSTAYPVQPRLLYRGNRTEVLLQTKASDGEPFVTKRLLRFANVSPERLALFREALLQHAARGAGVVPILGSTFQDIASSAEARLLRREAESIARTYVDGYSLREIMGGPLIEKLTETQCREWGSRLALILDRIHQLTSDDDSPLALVHRDVTPGNVLIERSLLEGGPSEGGVWLNDFGLAHVRAWGPLLPEETLQGTPRLIAPELISGGQPTSGSDVYQTGLLLASLVARPRGGRSPTRALSSEEFRAWAREQLRPWGIAQAVEEAPANRPTAREVAETLAS